MNFARGYKKKKKLFADYRREFKIIVDVYLNIFNRTLCHITFKIHFIMCTYSSGMYNNLSTLNVSVSLDV